MRALWGGCPKSEKNEKVRIKKMMKNKEQKIKIRLDTRPKPVADGWAGARMRVLKSNVTD